MKVVLFPADDGACGNFRIRYPVKSVAALGYDVSISEDNSPIRDGMVTQIGEQDWEIQSCSSHVEADIVVLQRPSSVRGPAIIRYLKKLGIRVVIELDDDFRSLTGRNQAWHAYQQQAKLGSNGQTIAALTKSISLADRVVVSTPALGSAYSTEVVCENCIPASYLDVVGDGEGSQTLGWSGSMSVHRGDLQVVGTGVRDALQRTGWDFRVVGQAWGVAEELLLGEDPPETGWVPPAVYPEEMAKLGGLITPLADDAFNRAKSWLTPLTAAALGIPFVASDLPEYHRLGAGLVVANKSKAWRSALLKLMTDEGLRHDLRVEGRKIAGQHTYEDERNALRFWEAWSG